MIGGQTKDEKPTPLFLESGDVLVMSQQSRLCYHAVPRVMKARQESWNCLIPTKKPETIESLQPSKKLRTDISSMDANETENALQWSMDPLLYQQVCNEIFWLPFKNYLHDSRINMNVRQVLKYGQEQLGS